MSGAYIVSCPDSKGGKGSGEFTYTYNVNTCYALTSSCIVPDSSCFKSACRVFLPETENVDVTGIILIRQTGRNVNKSLLYVLYA